MAGRFLTDLYELNMAASHAIGTDLIRKGLEPVHLAVLVGGVALLAARTVRWFDRRDLATYRRPVRVMTVNRAVDVAGAVARVVPHPGRYRVAAR
jgi:hypothetical protein